VVVFLDKEERQKIIAVVFNELQWWIQGM